MNLRDRKVLTFQDAVAGQYQTQQEWVEGEIQPVAFPDITVSIQRLLG